MFDGVGGVVERGVVVKIEPELRGRCLDNGANGRVQVAPRARLELRGHVAGFDSVCALAGPVPRRHVHAPPGERHMVAHLRSEELIDRHVLMFANGVEQSHLHTRPQIVIPQQLRHLTAEDSCLDVVGNLRPRIVGDRLADADDAVVR